MPDEHGPRPAADVTHPGGMAAKRVFPTDAQSHLDPFVVFERFVIEPSQGFDTHPHRGFEIVSYMLEGEMAHEDSMGQSSIARAGDAMRITTGSGMHHSEMPAGEAGCSGLQLWIALPRERKSVDPSYEDAAGAELPVEQGEGATVTTVIGEGSPLELHTPMTYHDAAIESAWEWEIPDGWNGFLYVVSGAGTVDGRDVGAAEYLVAEGGGSHAIATETGLRAVAVSGAPHGEPIRQRGPFVD